MATSRLLKDLSKLALLTITLLLLSPQTLAALDCPLRDAPFSVDSPLIDVLLSEEAAAAAEEGSPGIIGAIPDWIKGTTTPSFATIVSLSSLSQMQTLPSHSLEQVDRALSEVIVTDADRAARCARYDSEEPVLDPGSGPVKILIFTKINGYDHGPAVTAATETISALAAQMGWSVTVSDSGGAFTPESLQRFQVVVWNNVSGDVLTLSQRDAFQNYIAGGGSYLGIHASGGDLLYFWDWYADVLLKARFLGHPMDPQLQTASLRVHPTSNGIGKDLSAGWEMQDEWYSFEANPREAGVEVVVTIDESTYLPTGFRGQDLRMGDHPLAWSHQLEAGRAFYTAMGHDPSVYENTQFRELLSAALRWCAN